MFANLPSFATFQHTGVREGFEAVFFRRPRATGDGYLLEGGTTAVEDGSPWSVHYRIAVDEHWRTTLVDATGISPLGHHALHAACDGGRWRINDTERPDLDGCVDIDFESSVVTNTLAIHRLDLSATTPQDVPAAFVRADDLRVERVQQSYACTGRSEGRVTFDYTSSTFSFACQLVFDGSGLVEEYPGIGSRHG
jgi:hypothetical protein